MHNLYSFSEKKEQNISLGIYDLSIYLVSFLRQFVLFLKKKTKIIKLPTVRTQIPYKNNNNNNIPNEKKKRMYIYIYIVLETKYHHNPYYTRI